MGVIRVTVDALLSKPSPVKGEGLDA